MLLSQQRIAPWIICFFAALTSLIFLPRLLGKESFIRQVVAKRPNAVLTGITPLPDETVKQEVSTNDELRMLVPPESTPDQATTTNISQSNEVADSTETEEEAEPQSEAKPPSIRFVDAEPEETPSEPTLPKIVRAPATLGDPIIEEVLPGQPPAGQFEAAQPKPELPHTTLKFAPLEEEPAPKVAVPPTLELQAPIALPAGGLAVKYWIVSTRAAVSHMTSAELIASSSATRSPKIASAYPCASSK